MGIRHQGGGAAGRGVALGARPDDRRLGRTEQGADIAQNPSWAGGLPLAGCNASWPDIAIAVETDHLGVTEGVGPYLALSAASQCGIA